jgi:restriction endonuclease EcoRII-like protein
MSKARSVSKILSANDTGETGGHQAGILVPRDETLLAFFPALDSKKYNPRVHLVFQDSEGFSWEFAFIYYNNKLFGKTRNEYRLTRMTKYIRDSGLVVGDEVILSRDERGGYSVSFRRKRVLTAPEKVLELGSGWRIIDI